MRKTCLCPFSGQWFSSFVAGILLNAVEEPGTPKYPTAHAGRFIFGPDVDSIFLSTEKTRTERHRSVINKQLVCSQRFYLKDSIRRQKDFTRTDNSHFPKENSTHIIKAYSESYSREVT